ncbi:hypothetical protein EV426DRAFT_665599 [Tirmania nivea]|nr:hypothetical protein EV426DRAFT_665599 [Tirmania nivea]
MNLCTIFLAFTAALLILGAPGIAHDVDEAYYDFKLLQETCHSVKAKLGAIKPGHAVGGGLIISGCLKELNEAFDLVVQTRKQQFPSDVEAEIGADVTVYRDCLNEILSIVIPELLTIPEIEHNSREYMSELHTLVNQEEVSLHPLLPRQEIKPVFNPVFPELKPDVKAAVLDHAAPALCC